MKKSQAFWKFLTVLMCCYPLNSLAQFDGEYIQSHSVRVVAKANGSAKAASGFLWENGNQVVTSLHAIPRGSEISVACMGVSKPASVKRVLAKADLILLSVSGLPSACKPFTKFVADKPPRGTRLWTFGYHAGARSLTEREFKKSYAAPPETLDYLVEGKPLEEIKKLGFPDPKLEIYYVQGGLLPGYSGGPVIDENKNLVGIVDGGLNKGASSYNWVIPAKFLQELSMASESTLPSANAGDDTPVFASGFDSESEASVFKYLDGGINYTWALTKSQSLIDFAATADDAEGVGQLLDMFADTAGVNTLDQLVFDVYEEQNFGLIIAVPTGQPFAFQHEEGAEEPSLRSESMSSEGGFAGIRYAFDSWQVHNDLHQEIQPTDPEYFNRLITRIMIDCYQPGESQCEYISEMTRIIDFGEGNKILRFGVMLADAQGNPVAFDFYSIAVKEGRAFAALARIQPEGESGLLQCLDNDSTACQGDLSAAQNQLSQLLAVSLTSFAELSPRGAGPVAVEDFVYDDSRDDESTLLVGYYEGQELRFLNTIGKEWRIYVEGEYEVAVENERADSTDGGKVVLLTAQDGYEFTVPVNGGEYFGSHGNNEWETLGSVQPKEQSIESEGENND